MMSDWLSPNPPHIADTLVAIKIEIVKVHIPYRLILLSITLLAMDACKIQSQLKEGNVQHDKYIEDLRDIIRIGGQRTLDEKLLILNVRGKQSVFEITETNANILSNIKQSLIKNMSVTRNYDGNFDTKYNTILIITLKRKAYNMLKSNLKETLK